MKIMVTGGAGFIGSNFIKLLYKEFPNSHIINFDKLTYASNYSYISDIPHSFFQQDINDLESLDSIDYIVNFAAESHVDRSITDADPFIRTNFNGTYHLLKLLKNSNHHARFIQVSTDEVYGSIDYNFATEEHRLNPTSPYSASKTAADHIVMSYNKTFGIDTIIVRSSNNYGPNQYPEKLIPAAINSLRSGNKVTIYGRGMEQRQWIHVDDNCQGILTAMLYGRSGDIYNVASDDHPIKNIDVIDQLSVAMGSGHVMEVANFIKDPRPGHDYRYAMSNNKLKNLGWAPTIEFKYGLAQTVEWYSNAKKDS
jgi:dTDP-glucose 4,6-dehydratase